MATQHNHPAFPCEAQPDRDVPREHDYIQTGPYTGKFPGLSFRDWFASQALVGIIANSENAVAGAEPTNSALSSSPDFPSWIALTAYRVADAMLAEREKGGES